MTAPIRAALPKAEPVQALLSNAQAAVTAKQFDKALDLYLRSYLAGQKNPEIREQIHDCLRQIAQIKRLQDPAFRQFVLSLSASEALNLYADVVGKLATHHADKEKAQPQRLFVLSLQEIERALGDAAFRQQNLPQVQDEKLKRIVKNMQEQWPLRLPTTAKAARAALQELVRSALTELQLAEPSSLILEAICGACAGLDESTAYLPPMKDEAAIRDGTITRVEMTDPKAGVGCITIGRFRDTTPAEFERALQRLNAAGLRSLVIDLRGNTGGNFLAAIRLAERFVPKGTLVNTIGQVPEFDGHVFASTSGVNALALPLVVLVDGKTMSAAEVFATAVKTNGRATLIGTSTFGKGSIQSPVPLSSDGPAVPMGQLMVTIGKVLGPDGTPIHGSGIEPHVVEPEPTLQTRLATQRAAQLAEGMG